MRSKTILPAKKAKRKGAPNEEQSNQYLFQTSSWTKGVDISLKRVKGYSTIYWIFWKTESSLNSCQAWHHKSLTERRLMISLGASAFVIISSRPGLGLCFWTNS